MACRYEARGVEGSFSAFQAADCTSKQPEVSVSQARNLASLTMRSWRIFRFAERCLSFSSAGARTARPFPTFPPAALPCSPDSPPAAEAAAKRHAGTATAASRKLHPSSRPYSRPRPAPSPWQLEGCGSYRAAVLSSRYRAWVPIFSGRESSWNLNRNNLILRNSIAEAAQGRRAKIGQTRASGPCDLNGSLFSPELSPGAFWPLIGWLRTDLDPVAPLLLCRIEGFISRLY